MSRKEKMVVYHGIPKSVTDKSTVFYASLDGNIPNVYEESSTGRGYVKSPTGLGTNRVVKMSMISMDMSKPFTIDMWLQNTLSGCAVEPWGALVTIAEKGKVISGATKLLQLISAGKESPASLNLFDTYVLPVEPFKTNLPIHIRLVFDGTTKLTGYLNGKYFRDTTVTNPQYITDNFLGVKQYDLGINLGHNPQPTPNSCVVSDLHISNIDRGDVFPTLPQDFIDGKAIIVPPLGQQQIVGDPMYSQVTELKVPCFENRGHDSYSDVNVRKYPNIPELSTVFSDTWGANSYFKIKGLNGEIISGVIDSDTALAKVTGNAPVPVTVIECSDVTKFTVGDSIIIVDSEDNNSAWTYPNIISNINLATREITLEQIVGNIDGSWMVGSSTHYIYETTASSSSPLVKLADGTNVIGTWSGLGTKEATFTLGTNTPSLTGKDLYVTYSLNMPSGNSCFPELPYSVDKAYNGVGTELKQVSEVIVEDDFIGKVSGSTKECPYVYKMASPPNIGLAPSLLEPTQESYNRLFTRDSLTTDVTGLSVGEIPQQLFIFNLITMIETKLEAPIPSRDKVQWLRANISTISFIHVGFGVCPSGNRLRIKCLDNGGNWSGNVSHTEGAPTYLKFWWTESNGSIGNITSLGTVNLLSHTDASSSTVTSSCNTDYVKLEVKLKVDSTYTTLYCDNKRAREDSCNPVLIQKETKTVKRYIPSKENFVTECSITKLSPKEAQLTKRVHTCENMYLSTQGTQTYYQPKDKDITRECLGRLDNGLTPNKYNNSKLVTLPNGNSPLELRFLKVACTNFPTNSYDAIPIFNYVPGMNMVALKPFLCKYEGELRLDLYASDRTGDTINKEIIKSYSIPNRPLIK